MGTFIDYMKTDNVINARPYYSTIIDKRTNKEKKRVFMKVKFENMPVNEFWQIDLNTIRDIIKTNQGKIRNIKFLAKHVDNDPEYYIIRRGSNHWRF